MCAFVCKYNYMYIYAQIFVCVYVCVCTRVCLGDVVEVDVVTTAMDTFLVSGQLHGPFEGFTTQVASTQLESQVGALDVVFEREWVREGGLTDVTCARLGSCLVVYVLRLGHDKVTNALHQVVVVGVVAVDATQKIACCQRCAHGCR